MKTSATGLIENVAAWLRKNQETPCEICNDPFTENDEIISKKSGSRNSHRKYYHQTCWKSTFH